VLADGLGRFQVNAYAYCLMDNHYHVVVQKHRPNLSRLMRHFNGVYTLRNNRPQEKVGHLFQGRFKAVLVDCVFRTIRSGFLLSGSLSLRRSEPGACASRTLHCADRFRLAGLRPTVSQKTSPPTSGAPRYDVRRKLHRAKFSLHFENENRCFT